MRPGAAAAPRVVLLRGVNVGGRATLPMADLRAAAAEAGWPGGRTLLQSGNLVIEAEGRDADVAARLGAALAARLGCTPEAFVRDAAAWRALVAANPFPAEAEADPSHLLLMLLSGDPAPEVLASLLAATPGRERIAAAGPAALSIVYPDGIGRSRLTGGVIERRLGLRGTARNWSTVLKLAAMLG